MFVIHRPGYSDHCWCGLRNLRWCPRWPPEINARGAVFDLLYLQIYQINGICFCSMCLNWFMIHINMVSISGSWSNSRSNTKNSGKWLNAKLSFVIIPKILGKGSLQNCLLLLYQSLLKWEEMLYSKVNYNVYALIYCSTKA